MFVLNGRRAVKHFKNPKDILKFKMSSCDKPLNLPFTETALLELLNRVFTATFAAGRMLFAAIKALEHRW